MRIWMLTTIFYVDKYGTHCLEQDKVYEVVDVWAESLIKEEVATQYTKI